MSSLRENVSRRRETEPGDPVCVSLQPGCSALVVCQWRGATWVLPWSHFTRAQLLSTENDSQLELTFTHCLVALSGTNLRRLVDDLAALRVSCLRDLPVSCHPPPAEMAPHIARIEIRPSAPGIREMPA